MVLKLHLQFVISYRLWCGAKRIDPWYSQAPPMLSLQIDILCSKNCQRRHWREGHKQNCVTPADLEASAALDAAQ